MTSPRATGASALTERTACLLTMTGRVQGLGVRPAVFCLATKLGLTGSVRNTIRGVEIEIEGDESAVAAFVEQLPRAVPTGAKIDRLESQSVVPSHRRTFTIETGSVNGPLTAHVPVDMAVCSRCLHEVFHREDRRYRYPFTSCTACGPRYSIINSWMRTNRNDHRWGWEND